MKPVLFDEIELDRCQHCGGIWFDNYEEARLKKLQGSEAVDSGDPVVGRKFNEYDQIKCPRHDIQMLSMVVVDQTHITYESCPVCYGIYFDAGEFKDFKHMTLIEQLRHMLQL